MLKENIIDLDVIDWASIKKAALESKWIPPQYYQNDWVNDVCRFLKEGPEDFGIIIDKSN